MKLHPIQACALLIVLMTVACNRKGTTTKYENGYFSETIRCSENEFRWRLFRSLKGNDGLLAELAVVDGSVISFMPTVIDRNLCLPNDGPKPRNTNTSWLPVRTAACSWRYQISETGKLIDKKAQDALGSLPHGMIMSDKEFSNQIAYITSISTQAMVALELQVPCPFAKVQSVVADLSKLAGGCLILQHPQDQRMGWQEMSDYVDSIRSREERAGPDIPVFLPDAPVSQIERDFTFARCSHSATNLEAFVEQHLNDDAWAGKAQIEAGNALRARGQHLEAIAAYKKAITHFGTNIVPRHVPQMTVSDLGRLEMTRSLMIVTRRPTVISNITEIQNTHIRDALLKRHSSDDANQSAHGTR